MAVKRIVFASSIKRLGLSAPRRIGPDARCDRLALGGASFRRGARRAL